MQVSAGNDVYLWSGYQRFVDHFQAEASKNDGFRVSLSTPISTISLTDDGLVSVKSRSGETFECRNVIVTVPLGVLQAEAISFSPHLPPRRRRAIANHSMGLLDKLIVAYDEAWWHLPSGEANLFIPSTPSVPFLRSLFINSLAHRGSPVLIIYLDPEDAPAIEAMTDSEIEAWIHPLLRDRLPRSPSYTSRDPPRPKQAYTTRWLEDEFSRGSYSFVRSAKEGEGEDAPSPLDIVEMSLPLWEGRLGFAGEHTDLDDYARRRPAVEVVADVLKGVQSYAHGAVKSGWREAARVLALHEDLNGV